MKTISVLLILLMALLPLAMAQDVDVEKYFTTNQQEGIPYTNQDVIVSYADPYTGECGITVRDSVTNQKFPLTLRKGEEHEISGLNIRVEDVDTSHRCKLRVRTDSSGPSSVGGSGSGSSGSGVAVPLVNYPVIISSEPGSLVHDVPKVIQPSIASGEVKVVPIGPGPNVPVDFAFDTSSMQPPVLFITENYLTQANSWTYPAFFMAQGGVKEPYGFTMNVMAAVSSNPEFMKLQSFSGYTFDQLLQQSEFWKLLSTDVLKSHGYGVQGVLHPGGYLFWPPYIYGFNGQWEENAAFIFPKPGTYYAFVWLDYDNRIQETDESNNMLVLQIEIPPSPQSRPDIKERIVKIEPPQQCIENGVCESFENSDTCPRDCIIVDYPQPPTPTKPVGQQCTNILKLGDTAEINWEDIFPNDNLMDEVRMTWEGTQESYPQKIMMSLKYHLQNDQEQEWEGPRQISLLDFYQQKDYNEETFYQIFSSEPNVQTWYSVKAGMMSPSTGTTGILACVQKYEGSVERRSPPNPPVYPRRSCDKEEFVQCQEALKKCFDTATAAEAYTCGDIQRKCNDLCQSSGPVQTVPSETAIAVMPAYCDEGANNFCNKEYQECVDGSGYSRDAIERCNRDNEKCRGQYCSGKSPVPTMRVRSASGCNVDGDFNTVVPVFTRLELRGVPVYCDLDNVLKPQKEPAVNAMNNAECKSNFASNGKCINVEEQIGLLRRLVHFLSWIFGGGEEEVGRPVARPVENPSQALQSVPERFVQQIITSPLPASPSKEEADRIGSKMVLQSASAQSI